MAKEKQTLAKFEAVALPREQALQIRGGYKTSSSLPRTRPRADFIGWGEVEIRSNSFRVVSIPDQTAALRRN